MLMYCSNESSKTHAGGGGLELEEDVMFPSQ